MKAIVQHEPRTNKKAPAWGRGFLTVAPLGGREQSLFGIFVRAESFMTTAAGFAHSLYLGSYGRFVFVLRGGCELTRGFVQVLGVTLEFITFVPDRGSGFGLSLRAAFWKNRGDLA